MKVDKYNLCQPGTNNLSCFGCCGRDFTCKKEVLDEIDQNTKIFRNIKVPSTCNLLAFRDRLSDDNWEVTGSGVCSNLIKFNNGKFACPLHKFINDIVPKNDFLAIHKKDLRWGHCDVNYECESIIFWKQLNDLQKEQYFKWLKKQNYDTYDYSVGLVTGVLIRKFFDECDIIIDQ